MKDQNKKKEVLEEEAVDFENLTEEQESLMEDVIVADAVYDSVMEQLDLDPNNDVYIALVKNMLIKQAEDFAVFTIWNNLNEEQMANLKDYIDYTFKTSPLARYEDAMFSFSSLYPDLRKKLSSEIELFFENFVERFVEILND